MKKHTFYYGKFFFIRETPVRGIKAAYNAEAITEHKRSRIGWFVKVHHRTHTISEKDF